MRAKDRIRKVLEKQNRMWRKPRERENRGYENKN